MTNIGSSIGQYRLVRKIGAGGMGSVFVGEHILLGRRAAIKTLLPALSQQREIVERFFNEARATSAITDPGVVQVFDFGYHVDGTAYIVMELLEGESLAARLDRLGKLSPSQALRIVRQVAGALAAAHAADIIHRDLKPENIFLIRDAEAAGGERAKILDFGICKIGSLDASLTQTGATLGTPVYMSPEQCRGLGGIDGRSDVYSLGCVLFQVLTGSVPFSCESSGDFIVAHLQQEPPPPSSVDPELPPAIDAIVARCLAKAPADRYPSMTDLQAAIEEVAPRLDTTTPVGPVVAPARMALGAGFQSKYDGNFSVRISRWFHSPNPTTLRSAAGQTQDNPEPIRSSRRSMFAILVAAVAATALVTTFAMRHEDETVSFDPAIIAASVKPAIEPVATEPPPAPPPAVTAEPPKPAVEQPLAVTTEPPPQPKAKKPVAIKRPVRRPARAVVTRQKPMPTTTTTEDLYDTR